jgi:hypothetical protein
VKLRGVRTRQRPPSLTIVRRADYSGAEYARDRGPDRGAAWRRQVFGGALRPAVVGRYEDGGCSDCVMSQKAANSALSMLVDPSVFEAIRASKRC